VSFRYYMVIAAALALVSAVEAQVNSPPVQILIPGFEVFELPVQLPNLNNLRYREDGSLYALGYNGNVWLLHDTDGDGLEDASKIFFENKAHLRGPIGMAVVPAGHALLHRQGALVPEARGVVVASKGKVSALLDFDGDDVAEVERVIASGWKEIPPNVDTIGVAIHPFDGSIYFGLGTAAYNNAYLLDSQGQSDFDLASERGTIQRIKPDLSGHETVCTGVRFTIGMQFNTQGELFATDQEGATWLSNGNPFDELLHIRPGRHYGFPPRHPRNLPRVFDEPSLFDYRPQHQSTCGLVLNLARPPVAKTFGPESWVGNAFIAGESRGKLYRTQLVETSQGEYVAANQILACLTMLPVDCTLTPTGGLLLCCHSGGPDWGTGPSGAGKLFLIKERPSDIPRPIAVWPSSSQEVRIAFDRPLDPALLKGIAANLEITAGPYVAAGDRWEVLRPGYEVVKYQQAASRQKVTVYSAGIAEDRRTLVLATAPQTQTVQYSVQLPGMGREREASPAGALAQQPAVDVDYSLAGVHATWVPAFESGASQTSTESSSWTGILPHLDFVASRALRAGVPDIEAFAERLSKPGLLTLKARLDTEGLFIPVTQPGSQLDYAPEEDEWLSARELRLRSSRELEAKFGNRRHTSTERNGEHVLDLDLSGNTDDLTDFELIFTTGTERLDLHAEWIGRFKDGTTRSGPLPTHRLLVPWAIKETSLPDGAAERKIPELVGANWGRGRHVFRSQEAACVRCHVAHGEGGKIGPDLSNLVHRDYESVVRDIRHPSFAINPDFVTYTVLTKAGKVLNGVLRSEGDILQIGGADGQTHAIHRDDVEELRPSAVSVMPDGAAAKLSESQFRDLLAYLMLPPPRMPLDGKEVAPPPRTREEVAAVLAGAIDPSVPLKPLNLLLVAGDKDHGPGEHDYPAWLNAWSQLLAAADGITVDSAMEWPSVAQLEKADTIVIYQKGRWNAERAAAIDTHLAKGGGLVLIHWAIEGGSEANEFSRRIGLASDSARTKYRHGSLEVDWTTGGSHPIARNLSKLALHDESYWNLIGDTNPKLLAIGGTESGNVRPPLFWTVEPNRGRVFVSIPGHYSWTFDDPIYRAVLLRGIAWVSHESVDRLNSVVPLGVDFAVRDTK
jgi:putative heme-binding domain-containing protein